MKTVLTKSQKKTFTKMTKTGRIECDIRYDDDCGNGHNSFSITGTEYSHKTRSEDRYMECGGCIHDEIYSYFPEFRHLIKWHMTSSDGPMHYLANTTYHASNRDFNGLLKGEVHHFHDKTVLQFGDNPIKQEVARDHDKFIKWLQECDSSYDFEVIGIDHKERETYGTYYTFGGFGETWYDCPFNTEDQALEFLHALQNCKPEFIVIPTSWGEGKEREFDSARNCAVWPEATEEQLSLPKEELTKLLEDRLPALLNEFQTDIEALGFVF